MSTVFTPERIAEVVANLRDIAGYWTVPHTNHTDNVAIKKAAAIIEHLQGELTVERTHNGALSEANRFLAEAARERDKARALHADISRRYGALSAQLSEALREIERLKAALRNQNVSGIA